MPRDYPLEEIRHLTDTVLRGLSTEFDELYAASGPPSIAPEYGLRALLLQAFTRFARSGSWSCSWTITCCSAG